MTDFTGHNHMDTLLLIDWDDTLLPTSWLVEQNMLGEGPITLEADIILTEIAARVLCLLEAGLEQGMVTIVTNSQIGWVETTCARFLPRCLPLINSLTVMSARSTFEMTTADPILWKIMAFKKLKRVYTNIVSIGDSECEHQAAETLKSALVKVKTLRLTPLPTIHQFQRQLTQVRDILEWIVLYKDDLEVGVID
jgi:hypothetical protein